jgi:hypothetical protein
MNGQPSQKILYCKRCSFRVMNHHMCRICGSTSFFQGDTGEALPGDLTSGERLTGVANDEKPFWQAVMDEWASVQSRITNAVQQLLRFSGEMSGDGRKPNADALSDIPTPELIRTRLNRSLKKKLER